MVQHRQPIGVWHLQISDRQVEIRLAYGLDSRFAVSSFFDSKALLPQELRNVSSR
jgi:hypothetical protein